MGTPRGQWYAVRHATGRGRCFWSGKRGESIMTAKERVAALRRRMRAEGLAAYLVPSTDAHQSEYVPEHWKRRGWLSGFTGSAGDVVVTMKEAGLWTDSRYFLQAEQELDPEVFDLHKMQIPGTLTVEEFLIDRLRKGQVVGVDPQVLSKARAEGLEQALTPRELSLRFPARNLVDPLWKERPPLPKAPIRRHALLHPTCISPSSSPWRAIALIQFPQSEKQSCPRTPNTRRLHPTRARPPASKPSRSTRACSTRLPSVATQNRRRSSNRASHP